MECEYALPSHCSWATRREQALWSFSTTCHRVCTNYNYLCSYFIIYIYIYIYVYTSVSPCIKCTEKLWNRVCKNTTYRIRVDSVPHMGDLRMYERSHEPFLHLVQWDRTCKHIMESLSNMFGNMENTELPRPGKLERESELKTWCRVNISKPWPWTNCQKHVQ